jgi:hypothetical protein
MAMTFFPRRQSVGRVRGKTRDEERRIIARRERERERERERDD